ncbi:hypothetical protein Salat_0495600 [Sesamum alatum]|uniref:Uncharacterized protein n=1 Tax=Sesamum alatum TaxID=300844 RepID=A0AAE1Z4D6_9LAMI|nr:hypothetical protein Salat_0495600 [Sesamum alatum]
MRASTSDLVALAAVVFLLTVQPYEATRVLGGKQREWTEGERLFLPSLQNKPPSPNGCTYIPGGGGSPCMSTISQKNFAGRSIAARSPPPAGASQAYAEQVVDYGLAMEGRKEGGCLWTLTTSLTSEQSI